MGRRHPHGAAPPRAGPGGPEHVLRAGERPGSSRWDRARAPVGPPCDSRPRPRRRRGGRELPASGRSIRQTFFFSFVYTILGVPLAPWRPSRGGRPLPGARSPPQPDRGERPEGIQLGLRHQQRAATAETGALVFSQQGRSRSGARSPPHRPAPSVSRIRDRTTSPDSRVRAATTWIAAAMPSQSATRPARSAPTA